MKSIFKEVISRGGYSLSSLLKNIDKYHIEGKLTDAEREELYAAARGAADPSADLDLQKKLQELEQRIAVLENGAAAKPSAAEEYVPGKWYYNGGACLFGGMEYVCTAPAGVVCTWSPAEYPAYWEVKV